MLRNSAAKIDTLVLPPNGYSYASENCIVKISLMLQLLLIIKHFTPSYREIVAIQRYIHPFSLGHCLVGLRGQFHCFEIIRFNLNTFLHRFQIIVRIYK